MEERIQTKPDGFVGEKMIVIPKEEVERFRENIFVRRMYLTDIGYFPNARSHYFNRPDGISEYIYFFCLNGKGTIVINGQSFPLYKNTALCIPQNCPHSYRSSDDDPWSILWVHFNGTDVKHYPLEKPTQIVFRSAYSSNRMLFLFNELLRILESESSEGDFVYMSHTLQMILSETYFKQTTDDHAHHNDYLNVVLKFFNANLSRNFTLDDLCEEFNLSKSYLNALFKKHTAMSPINFFINLKMKEACKMLRSTTTAIKTIAANLGYSDQYYFSFLFKKTVGVSPTEFRNSNMVFI